MSLVLIVTWVHLQILFCKMLEDLRIRQVGAGLALPSAVALRLGAKVIHGDPIGRFLEKSTSLKKWVLEESVKSKEKKNTWVKWVKFETSIAFGKALEISMGKFIDLMEGGGHRCPRSRKTAGNVCFAGSSAGAHVAKWPPYLDGSTNVNHVQPLNPPFWRLKILQTRVHWVAAIDLSIDLSIYLSIYIHVYPIHLQIGLYWFIHPCLSTS